MKRVCAGIDAGSRTIKVVLIDPETQQILASDVTDQGVRQDSLARELFEKLLAKNGLSRADVSRIITTGYGRNGVTFADTTFTEITCHAYGVRHVAPQAMTLIEIGGQDSKLIRLDSKGGVRDFSMNDRCAAGTGRFLEVVAQRLGIELSALGDIACRSRKPAPISSMCVVFAETEIVGLLASGVAIPDVVAGIQSAIAERVVSMAGHRADPPVFFTGGVALVSGMREALEARLGQTVFVAPQPQMTGALGAALLACRKQ